MKRKNVIVVISEEVGGDYAYATEEERDQAIEAVVLAKLNEKIDF